VNKSDPPSPPAFLPSPPNPHTDNPTHPLTQDHPPTHPLTHPLIHPSIKGQSQNKQPIPKTKSGKCDMGCQKTQKKTQTFSQTVGTLPHHPTTLYPQSVKMFVCFGFFGTPITLSALRFGYRLFLLGLGWGVSVLVVCKSVWVCFWFVWHPYHTLRSSFWESVGCLGLGWGVSVLGWGVSLTKKRTPTASFSVYITICSTMFNVLQFNIYGSVTCLTW